MVDLGYSRVNIPDEPPLISNLRSQINAHNLKKHLDGKPLYKRLVKWGYYEINRRGC